MNAIRAIFSGVISWLLTLSSFMLMELIPTLRDSDLLQNLLVLVLLIPIIIIGLRFYHRKGSKNRGAILGVVMAVVALTLDAVLTVPLIIIPEGGDYMSFFTNPFLGLMFIEFVGIAHFYGVVKVRRAHAEG